LFYYRVNCGYNIVFRVKPNGYAFIPEHISNIKFIYDIKKIVPEKGSWLGGLNLDVKGIFKNLPKTTKVCFIYRIFLMILGIFLIKWSIRL
jgi:hypothetical protein